MGKLVLIGGGGHCKSVLDAALEMNAFDEITITDVAMEEGSKILGCTVQGSDEALLQLRKSGFKLAFITIGSILSTKLRRRLSLTAEKLGFGFPIIVDPTAKVSRHAQIGRGTFVGKNAVINAGARVGEHCIINTGAIIEHDCTIGDYAHVSVGAILCGDSHVGMDSFIGAGSTVIQGIFLGSQVIVGANSTVINNVNSNQKVYGIVKNLGG